jgi:hypothetical protein
VFVAYIVGQRDMLKAVGRAGDPLGVFIVSSGVCVIVPGISFSA